jgi:hypothetical protein
MTDLLPVEQPDDRSRRIEELVQRTQQAVLGGVEEIVQRQMTPFLERAGQSVRDTVDYVLRQHADSLLGRLKGVSLDAAEEMLKKLIEPFLERTRHLVLDGLENASFVQRYADRLAASLKGFLVETVAEVFQVHVPEYSRRFGRRVVDYVVAGTLYCLAAIFLTVGGILGLQQAGWPPYATFLTGGTVALVLAVVLLKLRHRTLPPSPTRPADRPPAKDL